jgi:CheY-like chemotaxis protein
VGDATKNVVGIVGDDPLTSRVLGLLLEGAGYEVRAMEAAAVLENPSASLAGVDLVLCPPPLGGEHKEELLGAMKGTPQTALVPVLRLSTEPTAKRTDSVLPWPWSTEALVGAIEQALHAPDVDQAP